MKRVKLDVRITVADTVSDVLVRLYKDALLENPDGDIAKDKNLSEIMNDIEKQSKNITTAINRDKVSTSLEHADTKRDEFIYQLFTLIAGYAAIPIADKKAAALKLLSITSKYKGIARATYAQESSLIESMLEDFADSGLTSSIEMLEGVADLIKAIRIAQDEFNAASDSVTIAFIEKGEPAYALKKPLLNAINEKLVPYITAMSAINLEYKNFSEKADIEINKANQSTSKKTKNLSFDDKKEE